jgi:hypothetical protein
LNSKRDLFYKGSGISDRDFAGNKLDYVGTAFLYSNNLSRTRSCEMSLVRMNASIFARSEEKKNTTDNSSAVDPQTNGVLQGYDGLILDNESSNESSNKSNITLIEGLTDVFFKPNRWIDYKAESYSDGVSIFRYRQADFDQLSMARDRVNAVNEGYERYTGSYSMSTRLNMYSRAENSSQEVPWLCLSCEELDFSPPDLFNASCGS